MDGKNKAETLKEQIEAISREPVSSAINNMQTEYLGIAKRLRALSLNVAGTVLNMLQAELQLRQEEMKNAIEEHKFQESVKQRAAAMAQAEKDAEAQKELARQQKEIEEANRPRLAAVGGTPVQ